MTRRFAFFSDGKKGRLLLVNIIAILFIASLLFSSSSAEVRLTRECVRKKHNLPTRVISPTEDEKVIREKKKRKDERKIKKIQRGNLKRRKSTICQPGPSLPQISFCRGETVTLVRHLPSAFCFFRHFLPLHFTIFNLFSIDSSIDLGSVSYSGPSQTL